jgi:signal transduction histidine kinase
MLERTWAAVRGTIHSKASRPSSAEVQRRTRTEDEPRVPVGHISRVFREVYEAERLSAGAIRIERRQESMRELTDRVIRGLREPAHARSVRVENAVPEDMVAPCDPARIVKVLVNLVSNAIAASNLGGRVTLDACADEGRVVVSVHDEGPGIDPRTWPYLFHEGWRDPNRKGEGLGLSVSKAIVRAHGGKIWCESALGRGTIIRFSLPTTPPEKPEGDPKREEAAPEVENPPAPESG